MSRTYIQILPFLFLGVIVISACASTQTTVEVGAALATPLRPTETVTTRVIPAPETAAPEPTAVDPTQPASRPIKTATATITPTPAITAPEPTVVDPTQYASSPTEPAAQELLPGQPVEVPPGVANVFSRPLSLQNQIGSYNLPGVVSAVDYEMVVDLIPGFVSNGFIRLEYVRPDGIQDHVFVPLNFQDHRTSQEKNWLICAAPNDAFISALLVKAFMRDHCGLSGETGQLGLISFNSPNDRSRLLQSQGFVDDLIYAYYSTGALAAFAQTGDSTLLGPDKILIPVSAEFQGLGWLLD